MEKYRGYLIKLEPKPGPTTAHDWDFWHEDYDGPEDTRIGTAHNINHAKTQIDELIEDESAPKRTAADIAREIP